MVIAALALVGCASVDEAGPATTVAAGTVPNEVESTTTTEPGEETPVRQPLSSVPPVPPVASYPADAYPPELAGVVDGAIADLAETLDIDAGAVTVVLVEQVVWPDRSLGCPQPDMMYAQVLTEGSRVLLAVGGTGYAYHSDGVIDPFLCASAPLEDLVADRLELIDPKLEDETFPTRQKGGPGGEPDV